MNPTTAQQAKDLYCYTSLSTKEIARLLEVDHDLLCSQVKEERWDELKSVADVVPTLLLSNYYSQLLAINETIAARKAGERYPTLEEADHMLRLTTITEQIQKQIALSENMGLLADFTNYMNKMAPEHADKLNRYADKYIKGHMLGGFHPDATYEGEGPLPPAAGDKNAS